MTATTTQHTTRLTELELLALRAIDNSEYGEYLDDAIWAWSIADHINASVSKRQIPGIVSSLSQKGLVVCNGDGKEGAVQMTDRGVAAYVSAVGQNNVRKEIRSMTEGGQP